MATSAVSRKDEQMFAPNVLREFLAALADTVHNVHISLRIELTVDTGDLSWHIRNW